MNCENFVHTLHAWLDGQLDAAHATAMHEHASRCRGCALAASDERIIRTALRELPVPALRPDFKREAVRAARVAGRTLRRKMLEHDVRIAALAASSAIAVLVFAALRTPVPTRSEQGFDTVSADKVEVYAVTEGEVQALRLRIQSPRDFDGVRFSVELPDDVSLAGQPGVRAMTWEGRLRKGSNVLELPLLAQAGAAGRVATRVAWGEFERHLETRLVSVPPDRNARSKTKARA
jgi:hypothetical protein